MTFVVHNSQARVNGGKKVPKVSIGLPVYNGARFISQALDSLLGQTFLDLEVIISDNASTDDTASICQGYASSDARIRYVRQPTNIGVTHNWNFVVHQARGKYFKWSSANDYYAPTMLEKSIVAMEADPSIVLCHGRTCLVEEEGDKYENYSGDIELTDERPSARFKTLCTTLVLNNAQSGVIRLDDLRRTRLDRHYLGGDLVLMAELALLGKFILLPEILFYRRMGPNTFSSLLNTDQAMAFFDPQGTRGFGFQCFQLHLDFLASTLRAPIALPEKLRTLLVVARHTISDRAQLWGELGDWLGKREHD